MIRPRELESDRGGVIWDTITAAATGDTPRLQRLLEGDPSLSRAGYFYTQPIHFAVRGGHGDAVRLLLQEGADPEWNGYHDGGLIKMARERGHESVARLLEEACQRRGRVAPGIDHPIHQAAQQDEVVHVQELLDADPTLVNRGDGGGASPQHRAVLGSARRAITFLLDRGADIHAIHSVAGGGSKGLWAVDLQAIDLAIWGLNSYAPAKRDFDTARMLVARGAAFDLTIAAALGDLARITALLDEDPDSICKARANGKRPLSTAIEFGHSDIARLFLDHSADPGWPELGAEYGASLLTCRIYLSKGSGQCLMVSRLQ